MFDARKVVRFAIGEILTGTHQHAIRKVSRHGSPPFAINALENSIQAQIPLTGHAFAEDTDLTKFGTRYYNPASGRWTQQVPVGGSLGSPDSLNRYLYARDDPVNVVDPSGSAISPGCSATLFVAGGSAVLGAISAIGAVVGVATCPVFGKHEGFPRSPFQHTQSLLGVSPLSRGLGIS